MGSARKLCVRFADSLEAFLRRGITWVAVRVMLESHLVEGKQSLGGELTYGQSITDGCISWDETEKLLREAHSILD